MYFAVSTIIMNKTITLVINQLLQNRWASHLIFWITLLAYYSIVMSSAYEGSYVDIVFHNAIILIPQILASYTLIYILIPKLLYKKKHFLFFISLLACFYIFSALGRIMVVHIVEELYRKPPFSQESIYEILTELEHLLRSYIYKIFMPVFVVLIIKLIKERLIEKNKLEVLHKEKATAELNFFKAQIHPHFLFNTLNNIYTLTLQKSDKAADTVLKLSEMLDYMLYQCNDDSVSIDKEIKLIENYIDLEKLRYGDRLQLEFQKEIGNSNAKIAPLILVSLIENAFKHGASGAIAEPIIKIAIKEDKGQLKFTLWNTKPIQAQKDETNFKKGIGLSNIEKQLNLLYPKKHQFKIIEKETSYKAILEISL